MLRKKKITLQEFNDDIKWATEAIDSSSDTEVNEQAAKGTSVDHSNLSATPVDPVTNLVPVVNPDMPVAVIPVSVVIPNMPIDVLNSNNSDISTAVDSMTAEENFDIPAFKVAKDTAKAKDSFGISSEVVDTEKLAANGNPGARDTTDILAVAVDPIAIPVAVNLVKTDIPNTAKNFGKPSDNNLDNSSVMDCLEVAPAMNNLDIMTSVVNKNATNCVDKLDVLLEVDTLNTSAIPVDVACIVGNSDISKNFDISSDVDHMNNSSSSVVNLHKIDAVDNLEVPYKVDNLDKLAAVDIPISVDNSVDHTDIPGDAVNPNVLAKQKGGSFEICEESDSEISDIVDLILKSSALNSNEPHPDDSDPDDFDPDNFNPDDSDPDDFDPDDSDPDFDISKASDESELSEMSDDYRCDTDMNGEVPDNDYKLSDGPQNDSKSSDGPEIPDNDTHLNFCDKMVEKTVLRTIENVNLSPQKRKTKLSAEDCDFDLNNPNVFVKRYQKGSNENSKTGRTYDLVHCCYFCHDLFTNIQTHIENKHCHKEEVKDIKLLKQKREDCNTLDEKTELMKEIRRKVSILRNKGDNWHNMAVMRKGEGEILLSRRTQSKFNIKHYGPCPECFEWIQLESSVSKHKTTCPAFVSGSDFQSKGSFIIQAKVITGKIQPQASKILQKEVLPTMRRDNITNTVLEDQIILMLGDIWLSKNIDNKRKRKHYASYHMRLAGRLLVLLREMTNLSLPMSDFLAPKYFDAFVGCTLKACDAMDKDTEDSDLDHPSTALKIGFDLCRMASVKLGNSIKSGDEQGRLDTTNFLNLMKLEWTVKVTKIAKATLNERQFNVHKSLPDPGDIATLAKHISSELNAFNLKEMNPDNYRNAVILAESRLLLYNRRRPGELEALR